MVIKSVVSVVGSREDSFCVPIWRCLRSRRWPVDGKPCTGFPTVRKIWKEISVKFSQAQHSSYPEHNHQTMSRFFASYHMNRLICRQGWGETVMRNLSRIGLKSLHFWLNWDHCGHMLPFHNRWNTLYQSCHCQDSYHFTHLKDLCPNCPLSLRRRACLCGKFGVQ